MPFPFETTLCLETSRALLRPLVLEDRAALVPLAVQPPLVLSYSPQPIHTEELLHRYLEKALAERAAHTRYPFTIIDKAQGRVAGTTSYLSISEGDRRLEIGATWIVPSFQGTGLNQACKYLLLQWAFDTWGAERVELKTDERNLASRRAIEKIGGRYEGTLRSHTLLWTGHRRHTVYYSILQAEWPALQPRLLAALNN